MTEENGLLAAYLLDGRGGGRELEWGEVRSWTSDAGPLWVHLDYTHPEAGKWLEEESDLDLAVVAALTAEGGIRGQARPPSPPPEPVPEFPQDPPRGDADSCQHASGRKPHAAELMSLGKLKVFSWAKTVFQISPVGDTGVAM